MTHMETLAPLGSNASSDSSPKPVRIYGGIGRVAFFFCWAAITAALATPPSLGAASQKDANAAVPTAMLVLHLTVLQVPTFFRLKNIGTNPWWCILMLVPIANFLVWIRCIVLPAGYQDTSKLDTAAKTMIWTTTIVLLLLLLILLSQYFIR
jgi:uncharacterized membrane protein YhaH (DUF805 family)